MDPIDVIWQTFLTSLGMDPSGNSPLPEGTDPMQFYQSWENFLLNSSATPPAFGGGVKGPGGFVPAPAPVRASHFNRGPVVGVAAS